ncbi:uncharacterized protein BO80DRAFT_93763 [Aspergillus ibericus CBS 121593]|uniref:Uncharacterized protein n=1 Tax=Aspergillus ibericus CBS 121593 TaxID=1448316 RepID=A0A395H1A3_9EURO|nr:hypothetical protein BO80DRAFT_93763 [Aspergillus ibericus CBS 121593]RAL00628.1 hypothetical protein BO80DRAFT_93763 [Aspergillus ibericus CBS 121593]
MPSHWEEKRTWHPRKQQRSGPMDPRGLLFTSPLDCQGLRLQMVIFVSCCKLPHGHRDGQAPHWPRQPAWLYSTLQHHRVGLAKSPGHGEFYGQIAATIIIALSFVRVTGILAWIKWRMVCAGAAGFWDGGLMTVNNHRRVIGREKMKNKKSVSGGERVGIQG